MKKIGFIGAGKVGCSLGKYFADRGLCVAGYVSRKKPSAEQAARFVKTRYFETLEELAGVCDILWITTPDGVIRQIWENLRGLPLENKWICHCSGSLSSSVFSGIEEKNGFGYSVHPLQAFCDKETSYQALEQTVFTLEGSAAYLADLRALLEGLGNRVQVISTENKSRYHCAAVTVSNHVIALVQAGIDLLKTCGFSQETAQQALFPLVENNVRNLVEAGPAQALTGPVERGDVETVRAHLDSLGEEDARLYRNLCARLIPLAKERHPQWDDTDMMRTLMEDAK